jgi:nucleotide-binding universal stress UspA family protein
MAKIVVGVDGSAGARSALAWAAAEARLRDAALHVVHAYHTQELAAPAYAPTQHALPGTITGLAGEPSHRDMAAALLDRERFEEAYHSRAEQWLDTLLGELDGTIRGVDVRPGVLKDRHPAEALLETSGDADLLVVGSRGHRRFPGVMLGSVSHAVVLHAVCPVVVVPASRVHPASGVDTR